MPKGLSPKEAKKRLREYGLNEIKKKKKKPLFEILLSQFTSPIILLLIGAAILSIGTSLMSHENYVDGVLIIAIVLAAGFAGFFQDYKAEEAVEALRRMSTPKARVIRNGKEQEISSLEVVPGDILVLGAGEVVPADAVLLSGELEVDEAFLTGESRSVKKQKDSAIYSNSNIYTGKAFARVTETGMKTKVGQIAFKMQQIKEAPTQFQEHMDKFTKKIVVATVLIIVVTFIVNVLKFSLIESLLIAISLAVAAIPEDLPAVITVAVSLGARRMAKENALIRRLTIAESIGTVDVICTDKTGTLTKGKMSVEDLWLLKPSKLAEEMAFKVAYYCNDAERIIEGKKQVWIGDETDIALKEYAFNKIRNIGKRKREIPFSSKKEMMTVVQELGGKQVVFSKGAPEVIVAKSAKALVGTKEAKLTQKLRNEILSSNDRLAAKGYRVIALAYKNSPKDIESGLTFIGLAVLLDPPHPEVKTAVKECHTAGIRVIMITGDNPKTAKTVAEQVGIMSSGVVLGSELDKMDDGQLEEKLNAGVNIFARTNPFHKLRILNILQKQGHVVAMTGDGINDSLAIKKADVGISMGVSGTEVAKEASDIILLDDNFATIRDAIKSGRTIFDNIRKFVDYLMTCNTAEVVVVLLASLFLPFISLYPVQLLWINLITDGLPALALSVDPSRPDVMKRKPRKRDEGIINKKLAMLIGGIGIKKSLVIIATFLLVLPYGVDKARTALFTAFIMYEFIRIAVIRYNEKLASLREWFSNKLLNYSLLVSLMLQVTIIYTPLAKYFKVVPLGLGEWGIILIGTAVGFVLGIAIAYAIDMITNESY